MKVGEVIGDGGWDVHLESRGGSLDGPAHGDDKIWDNSCAWKLCLMDSKRAVTCCSTLLMAADRKSLLQKTKLKTKDPTG